MRHFSRILLGLTALIAIASCKKSDPPVFHEEYFGLEQGRYVVYNVTEMIHDEALFQHDTLYYQLKTYWADTFVDNQGRVAREFWRYRRDSVTQPWTYTDTWTGIIDGIRAELIEENQRRVKLVFAPTLSKFWDANAYNIDGQLDCFYRDIHQDSIIGGTTFDSTLVVEFDTEPSSLIDSVKRYEMYSKYVGLVFKYDRDIHWTSIPTDPERPDYGREIYYEFVATGFE